MPALNLTNLQTNDEVQDNSAIGAFQRLEFTIDGDQVIGNISNYEFYIRVGWTNLSYSDQNPLPSEQFYYFENLSAMTSYTFAGRWQSGGTVGDRNDILSPNSFLSPVDNGGDIQLAGTLYFQNVFDVVGNYGRETGSAVPRHYYTKDARANAIEINNGFAGDVYSGSKYFNITIWARDTTDNSITRCDLKHETGLRFYNRELNNVDPTILDEINWQIRVNNAPVSAISITNPTEVRLTFENISAYPNANITNNALTGAWIMAIRTNSTQNTDTPANNNELSTVRMTGPAPVDSSPFDLTHNASNTVFDTAANTTSNGVIGIPTPNYFQTFARLDETTLTVGDTYRFICMIRLTADAVNPNSTQGTQDYTFISPEYTVENDLPQTCDLLNNFVTIRKSELCDYYSCYLNRPNFAPGEQIKVRRVIDFTDYNANAASFSRNTFDPLTYTSRTRVVFDGQEIANVDKTAYFDLSTGTELDIEYDFTLPYNTGSGYVITTINIPQPVDVDRLELRTDFIIDSATPNQLSITSQYTNGSPLEVLCEQEILDIQSCAEHTNIGQSSQLESDSNFHMASTREQGFNVSTTPIENQDASPTGLPTSDDPIITTQDTQYDGGTNIACSTLNTASLPIGSNFDIYHYRKAHGFGLDFENVGEIVTVPNSNVFLEYDLESPVTRRKVIELSFYLKSVSECRILSKYSLSGLFGFEFGIDASGRFRFTKLASTITYSDQYLTVLSPGYYHVVLQLSGNEGQANNVDLIRINGAGSAIAGANPPSYRKHIFFNGDNFTETNDGPLIYGDTNNPCPIILFSSYMYGVDAQLDYNTLPADQFILGVNRTPYFLSGLNTPIYAHRFNVRDGNGISDFGDNNLNGSLQGFGSRTAFGNGAWVIK